MKGYKGMSKDMICKDCVRYDMCSSLMLEWYEACALGIRGRCDHYKKAEQALKKKKEKEREKK